MPMTESEKSKCQKIIHGHAAAAAAGNLVPVPGVGLATDTVTMTTMAMALASVFGGTVTGFAFSLAGGLLALLGMALLLPRCGRSLSLLGVSVAGAALHNCGQICAAMAVLGTVDVLGYLPLLLVSAVPMGLVTGLTAREILGHLHQISKN